MSPNPDSNPKYRNLALLTLPLIVIFNPNLKLLQVILDAVAAPGQTRIQPRSPPTPPSPPGPPSPVAAAETEADAEVVDELQEDEAAMEAEDMDAKEINAKQMEV